MNIGIVTSFLIGGLMLLTLLGLHNRVLQSSYDSTVQITSTISMDVITSQIDRDMRRVGFGADNEILQIDDTDFEFKALIDGQDRTIRWYLLVNAGSVMDTLVRADSQAPGDSLKYPVSDFLVEGFRRDHNGTQADDNPATVNVIRIEIIRSATDDNSDNLWSKLYAPSNLSSHRY